MSSSEIDTQVKLDPRRLTSEEEEQFKALRLRSIRAYPYLSHTLFIFRPYILPSGAQYSDTFSVDGNARLFLGEDALKAWTAQEQAGVLLHEVNHLLRRHSDRNSAFFGGTLNQRNCKVWNLAADMEINDDLRDLLSKGDTKSPRLPDNGVFPSTMGFDDGLTAEQYTRLILDQADKDPNGSAESSGGDGNQGSQPDLGDDSDGEESGEGEGGSGNPVDQIPSNCSSRHQDVSDSSVRSRADDLNLDGVSPTQLDSAITQTCEDIVEHSNRERGSVPAGMLRVAKEYLSDPVVDWRKELRSSVSGTITAAVKEDYSYRRVNRRAENTDIIPGMQSRIPRVWVFVDTSGSMSQDDLTSALSEIDGIARRRGIRGKDLQVLCVDAKMTEPQSYRGTDSVKLIGGGGTDMRLCFEYVKGRAKSSRPEVMIVITDGFTPWPDSDELPGMKKLILITTDPKLSSYSHQTPPDWAKTILIGG